MRTNPIPPVAGVVMLLVVGCVTPSKHDLAHDPFPDSQGELREVLHQIIRDCKTANVEGLRESHLVSDRFTKFGPGSFERQSVDQCNESEAAFFTSIQDLEYEARDLRIDVFGEAAVMTFYPHFSFKKDGEVVRGSSRQTFVFVKTADGWKLVHEHGTPKATFVD